MDSAGGHCSAHAHIRVHTRFKDQGSARSSALTYSNTNKLTTIILLLLLLVIIIVVYCLVYHYGCASMWHARLPERRGVACQTKSALLLSHALSFTETYKDIGLW